MRRWKQRYEEYGYDGLFDHRLGKPSPKRVPLATVEEIPRLYQEQYADFNVRYFHDKRHEQHHMGLSYTWVKRALQMTGTEFWWSQGGSMQTKFGFSMLFLTVALVVSVGQANPCTSSPEASEIARGRYLVEEVAKCGECHTPRNAQGELDRHAWLAGAPIWIMPVKAIPNWADRAPALAGFPGLTEEEGERVLAKGTGPKGKTLMHIYHMNQADAKSNYYLFARVTAVAALVPIGFCGKTPHGGCAGLHPWDFAATLDI